MLKILKSIENPVVVCHSHSDVDAVCAGLIIANKLNCQLAVPDFVTHKAQRIINTIVPKHARKIIKGIPSSHNVIVVDANSPNMVGINKCKVIIDHHPHPKIKAEHYFVDSTASSTCEIIAKNIKLNDWERVLAAAGIIDDTNILRTVSPHTLQILSILITFEQYNRLVFLLTQHYSSVGEKVNVLKTLKNAEVQVIKNKVMLTVKSKTFDPNITDRLMEFGDIVILFSEKEDGINVMLRTTDIPMHCGELLRSFDVYGCTAGGHMHAASMFCPLMNKEIIKEVERKIKHILNINLNMD